MLYLQLTDVVATARDTSFWMYWELKAGLTAFNTPAAALENTLNIATMADKIGHSGRSKLQKMDVFGFFRYDALIVDVANIRSEM